MQEIDNQQLSTTASGRELPLLVINLLKGVIYQDSNPELWLILLKTQAALRDYVSVLGLQLILDETEGYAFLRSLSEADETLTDTTLPRLMARRSLTFQVSLLLALLRKKLAEFDVIGGGTRLILTRSEIVDMVRLFLPENTNEVKVINKIDANLNKIVELGFLRRLKAQSSREDTFEVQRILKAFVDAQWLSEFDARLALYQKHLKEALGDLQDD